MNVRTGGPWEGSETDNHINVLELQAAYFALKSLCTNKTGIHIRLMMDSMTAVSYIREQGGSKSLACNAIARKIWLWAFERQIWLSSEHLVGSLNVTADYESRHFQMETEWMLDKSVFKNVVLKSGFEPNIDLFVSRVNCQITKFVSWKPQPEAYAVNAFSLDWHHFKPYCFPTFSIIPWVLQKISLDKVTALVVIPNWPTQPFYATAMNMLVNNPTFVRKNRKLLQMPNKPEEIHKIWNKLDLLVCQLSGDQSLIKDYQEGLQILCSQDGDVIQRNNMRYSGCLVWNSLPEEVKNAQTIATFHNRCLKWLID